MRARHRPAFSSKGAARDNQELPRYIRRKSALIPFAGDIKMLKKTVLIIAAAALSGGALPTQTSLAGDDIWDMMNPSWWYDEMFDDDDDKWWRRYRYHPYNPYWGGRTVRDTYTAGNGESGSRDRAARITCSRGRIHFLTTTNHDLR